MACELTASRLPSASRCLRLSTVSARLGHFMMRAKRRSMRIWRFLSFSRSFTARRVSTGPFSGGLPVPLLPLVGRRAEGVDAHVVPPAARQGHVPLYGG